MRLFAALALLTTSLLPAGALAFQVPIDPGDRSVYLRVGDGNFDRNIFGQIRPWTSGGRPRSGGAVSRARAVVAATDVGNGIPQAMVGNGRTTSDYDGFQFCNAGEIYVGGYFRRPGNNSTSATLSILADPGLTGPGTNTIPISEISWTSSGNGDVGAQPIPGGTLVPGLTPITTFPQNLWTESCLSFRYANSQVVAGGTYTTTITFTLVTP